MIKLKGLIGKSVTVVTSRRGRPVKEGQADGPYQTPTLWDLREADASRVYTNVDLVAVIPCHLQSL